MARDIYLTLDFSGNLGDIWLFSENPRQYRAVLIKPNGDEQLFTFPHTDLDKWLKKLEVPKSARRRAELAATFPRTLEDIKKRYETSREAKKAKTKYLTSKEIFSTILPKTAPLTPSKLQG